MIFDMKIIKHVAKAAANGFFASIGFSVGAWLSEKYVSPILEAKLGPLEEKDDHLGHAHS